MSSTRIATDGGFHQERFCSAAQFEKGLLANLVAKRCELLPNPKDRELIWFAQLLSHRDGLEKLSAELLKRFPEQIGTPAMRRFGMAPGQVYTPDQVAAIGAEIANAGGQCPLLEKLALERRRSRLTASAAVSRRLQAIADSDSRRCGDEAVESKAEACSYALFEILDLKELETELLPKLLAQMCMEPTCDLAAYRPWYFPTLVECLREYMGDWVEARRAGLAATELSGQVFESLDFALQSGGMVVLDGPPLRIGKSFAARTWCELHPGLARYVHVPASNDDIGFFRAIAESIGSASAFSFKGVQLRERVEVTLQSSKVMLVLDDAHYLWPQNNRREALPNRLNWLLAGLVKHGVPVALLTTPQFARDQVIVEKKTGWTNAQFLSQISEYKKLPQVLSKAELIEIAELCLPAAERKLIQALALYAVASGRYLTAIESVVKRARFIAGKAGREAVTFSDVDEAINHHVIPSDLALSKALDRGADRRPTETERETAPAPATPAVRTVGISAGPARSFTRGGRPLDHTEIETLSATLK
jgi:hypothetical protein